MKLTYIQKLIISGTSTVTNNENETSEEKAKIGELWDKYVEENIYSKTFNKANNTAMYATYTDYENKDSGDYKVTIGVEVLKPKNAITIEKQKYLMFSKKGELPQIVIELWKEILEYFENNNEYERAYTIDLEKYAVEDEIEIYISIK